MKLVRLLICCLLLFPGFVKAQEGKVIDKIIAIVGNNIILYSDIETQYGQYIQQGNNADETVKCAILEQMLLNKLLLHQSKLDSVEVQDSQVEAEMDKRINYFVAQLGSVQKLEEFYQKSVVEIKDDFKDLIRDQLAIQSMHGKLTGGITVSPMEVKQYFESIPKDSLPLINAEVEVAQIVIYPKIQDTEKARITERLEELRQRVLKGEDFSTMAILYSEDVGSARKGGELGFLGRGELVPEFEAVAFKLKGKEVSKIVETQFGYHIIQAIERRGDQSNFRHILLKPKVDPTDVKVATEKLDSIALAIRSGSITFVDAAKKFSEDTDTKYNGGLIVNTQTGYGKFETSQLDPSIFFFVDKLNSGEISEPAAMKLKGDKTAYRIIQLRSRTEPHTANMKDDYQKIQDEALNDKQIRTLDEWVEKKKSSTYIRIDKEMQNCEQILEWLN